MRVFAKAAFGLLTLSFLLLVGTGSAFGLPSAATNIIPQTASTQAAATATLPVLLTPAQLEALLPATVYFKGKSAAIQLRNAAGVRFGPDGYFLATVVETGGYASSVQEVYQIYLITESAVSIGGQRLNPGAYGAGVVNGKLSVMDVGGHTLLQADTTLDQAMPRPRPLQLVTGARGGLRLYVGRNWVTVSANDTH